MIYVVHATVTLTVSVVTAAIGVYTTLGDPESEANLGDAIRRTYVLYFPLMAAYWAGVWWWSR